MSKIDLRKNWIIRVTGVFFLSSFIVLFLFSDFFLDFAIQNTVVWLLIQQYRWIFILLSLSVLLYFLLRKPYKNSSLIEESLTESRKNYRLVVDNLKDDYFFYRHEVNIPFKYLSASVSNVLGFSKTDFIETFRDLGAANLYNNCFERHKQLEFNDLKQPPFEIEMKNSNGSLCYLEIKEIPVKDDKGNITAIEGIARNITRYRRAEKELMDRENKYHTLFEAANDGFFIMKDDKFIDCNSRITEIFDCKLEDLIMHTPYHYRFSPTTQPDGRSSREKAREKIDLAMCGQPQNFEWVHLRNGSKPFYAEVNLNKFSFNNEDYLLAVIRDIADRKNAEKELLHHEKNFRLIFENSPFGIANFDTQGKITECNEKLLQIFNIDRQWVVGLDLFSVERNHDLVLFMKKCLSGEKGEYKGVYNTKDNTGVNIQALLIPVFDSEQKITGGFGIVQLI